MVTLDCMTSTRKLQDDQFTQNPAMLDEYRAVTLVLVTKDNTIEQASLFICKSVIRNV
ncbi:hypothetical protein SISNIDRAFT_448386 [Sistotremastrum niveocremeum HHB9708]|uniref:Uncharacterized protein n=2 Tax=Sistotremastraceae TaxID=3402574 RepID=A0A164ZXX4_9AGAM|nr:hypothetical protein SISNIDRAFT_448386 [Sistotremastrum niveocremeum HHB9708]KZT40537.1 hypothetical protein SISSUDRAFT_1044040 [Sistotremastrum suecicum HHB10207 ss-3]